MNKLVKAAMINEAIAQSPLAVERQARAIVDHDKITYCMLSDNGRYVIRASFREVMNLLNGNDIRRIVASLKA